MDLRTRTTLLCAAFSIAITVSILLHSRKQRVHYLLSAFAANMALWYMAQWLLGVFRADIWFRLTALFAVLLPQSALHLFAAISSRSPTRTSPLLRWGAALGLPMLVLALSNYHALPIVRVGIFFYVFGLVAAGLADLALRARRSPSRAVQERVVPLVLVGALAFVFSIGDFIWFIGAEIPPVGAVLSVVFLFALAESMRRERLIDLYEMIGRLVVSTALAFCLAGIFYAFVTYVGFDKMYLNAVLAAIAILVLFEPLRIKVEEKIHSIFFRQRRELELAVRDAQQRLAHVLEIEEMGDAVMAALENTRRLTSVALYLAVPDGYEFTLRRALGEGAPARIEAATLRAILEYLRSAPSLVLETVAREAFEARLSENPDPQLDAIVAASHVLGGLQTGVVLGVRASNGEIVGLLIVQDDRVGDAFSVDEVALLEGLAAPISVVLDNTHAYARLKERDRLAVLGQMAAGLAHEIKNPLGSIKGAAQLLLDGTDTQQTSSSRDFLNIIIEEVDRLDRVLSSALDYARPNKGDPGPVDVNALVLRTMQILGPSISGAVSVDFALEDKLPRVRVDAEQLRQVLMNLVRNGLQAISARGSLTISTRKRRRFPHGGWRTAHVDGHHTQWVEISVRDTGQGISPKILNNLFVPFFSTKTKGSGLGLAISQRIVQAAGGAIEVASEEGAGSTFTVVLPVTGDPEGTAAETTRRFDVESGQPLAPGRS